MWDGDGKNGSADPDCRELKIDDGGFSQSMMGAMKFNTTTDEHDFKLEDGRNVRFDSNGGDK